MSADKRFAASSLRIWIGVVVQDLSLATGFVFEGTELLTSVLQATLGWRCRSKSKTIDPARLLAVVFGQ